MKACFETGSLIREGKACSGMDFLFGKGMPAGVSVCNDRSTSKGIFVPNRDSFFVKTLAIAKAILCLN